MEDYKKFKSLIEKNSYKEYRNNFRDNYSEIENLSKKENQRNNLINWLGNKIDIINENEDLVTDLIKMDYVKSNSFQFQVKPDVKSATDFLRKYMLDKEIKSDFKGSQNEALLIILRQIRDNLTHYNKSEIESVQFNRNYKLIEIGSKISDIIIGQL